MTNFDKKIQQRGWNYEPYKYVRNKINNFLDNDEVDTFKTKAKKKYPCKRLKGEHDFVFVREWGLHCFDWKYKDFKCSACGKEKAERVKK